MNTIKIALISMTSTDNKKENLENALSYIQEAIDQGSDWICLPEVFTFIGPPKGVSANAEPELGPTNKKLCELAKKNGITLFAGSVPERCTKSHALFNTSYVFCPKGKQVAKYQKIHLFELKDSLGKVSHSEREVFTAGKKTSSFQHGGWNVGLGICYDLRFPELFLQLSTPAPLDVIFLPSAFTNQTGKLHWHTLLKARAIEQQCFVVAPNQLGHHWGVKHSYGHSLVVSPWGEILIDSKKDKGVFTCEIKKEDLIKARSQINTWDHRKKNVFYGAVE